LDAFNNPARERSAFLKRFPFIGERVFDFALGYTLWRHGKLGAAEQVFRNIHTLSNDMIEKVIALSELGSIYPVMFVLYPLTLTKEECSCILGCKKVI
jgi:hypothetical protein